MSSEGLTPNETEATAVRPIIIQLESFDNLENNPKLQSALAMAGFSAEDLKHIIDEDFIDVKAPYEESLPFGDITEDVVVRTTRFGEKGEEVEVSKAHRDQNSTVAPSTADMQLRAGDGSGYKILIGLEQGATLCFPRSVEPVGYLYATTGEYESVEFGEKTVAIIPSTVAWFLKDSDKGMEYLYVSTPPYTDRLDKTVENLG